MSTSLTDQLFQQLQGAPLQQIAQQLGAGQAQTAGAVSAALPLLLGALGRNASQPQGAEALYGALQNDFSGVGDLGGLLGAVLGGTQSRQTNGAGILGHVLGASQPQGAEALYGALQNDFSGIGDLGGLLGAVLGGSQSRQTNGAGILDHVLGAKQSRAEAGLAEATGLGSDKARQLMVILAPIVLAFLARQLSQRSGAGATGQGGASAQLLGAMLGQEQQQVRQQGGIGGGLLGAVLDQDGDGQVGLGDVLKIGAGLLGGKR